MTTKTLLHTTISLTIEQDDSWDGVWKFKEILGHKRVQPSDPDYMGSMAHVQLLWETGEVSWEPLHTKTRPACTTPTVTVAIYAEKHGLLDTLAGNFRDSRNEPRPRNDLSAALTKQSIRSAPRPYTCTVPSSRDYEQAVSIDEDNKNTKWQDSTENSVRLMNTRPSMTKERISTWPWYKKIRVHLIYAVKHDGRHNRGRTPH
jgi:hypothetical protein